jgi:hypothetical protein
MLLRLVPPARAVIAHGHAGFEIVANLLALLVRDQSRHDAHPERKINNWELLVPAGKHLP